MTDVSLSQTTYDDSDRFAYQGTTLLAKGEELSCDTWHTHLNNNMLVIGPSGAGKTRDVAKPNLLQMGSSFIVLDTKGTLCREVGPVLAAHGYEVQRLNFADLCDGGAEDIDGAADMGYNPLAFIRRDATTGRPSQTDILTVAYAICPVEGNEDGVWAHAAAGYLACFIAYALEQLPKEEQTLQAAMRLLEGMGDKLPSPKNSATDMLLQDLEVTDPQSLALTLYRRAKSTEDSPQTHASVLFEIMNKTISLATEEAFELYANPRQVDFARMGHERVALFVTVSDCDRSLDPLTSLFVTQAITQLEREADGCEGGRLPWPVRLYLDDFANLYIDKFDDVLSVIRSREIWCTLLLQTVTQLEARYGSACAQSIIGNCDTQLVLGFQDQATAESYAKRANRSVSSLMELRLGRAWLFVHGEKPHVVSRYDLTEHPLYGELPEAQGRAR